MSNNILRWRLENVAQPKHTTVLVYLNKLNGCVCVCVLCMYASNIVQQREPKKKEGSLCVEQGKELGANGGCIARRL